MVYGQGGGFTGKFAIDVINFRRTFEQSRESWFVRVAGTHWRHKRMRYEAAGRLFTLTVFATPVSVC